MLQAQRDMAQLQFSAYPNMKKESRDKLWRSLKQAAAQFMVRETKDYKEVVKNLALNLMRQKDG